MKTPLALLFGTKPHTCSLTNTMKTSLSFLPFLLSVFLLLPESAFSQQASLALINDNDKADVAKPLMLIGGLEGNVAPISMVEVEGLADEENGMSAFIAPGQMLWPLRISATGAERLIASDDECQSCVSVGGYSQIGNGLADQLVFYAYTFPTGSDPYNPCYSAVSGTVTFEFEVTDYQTGELIARGSVPRNFGRSSGFCRDDGYFYNFGTGPFTNDLEIGLPGVDDVWVELKTIHKVGDNPGQTYVHETSGRFNP